jgi:hypothetical protein
MGEHILKHFMHLLVRLRFLVATGFFYNKIKKKPGGRGAISRPGDKEIQEP